MNGDCDEKIEPRRISDECARRLHLWRSGLAREGDLDKIYFNNAEAVCRLGTHCPIFLAMVRINTNCALTRRLHCGEHQAIPLIALLVSEGVFAHRLLLRSEKLAVS